MQQEVIIRNYFKAWIDNDIETVKRTFAKGAKYSECYGPKYHGIQQILKWFEKWNQKGRVLEWTIKRVFQQNKTIIVEWYFKCEYENKVDGFNGEPIKNE